MSDSDRELRDRLEAAQSELKRAQTRLDELETVAADRDVLKGQLEVAQADLKVATERLAELEEQSVEALEEELDEVTLERDGMRQRLEQADKTRESWDGKLAAREAELTRLKEELASQQRPASPPTNFTPWWAGVAVMATIAGSIILRSCL